MHRIDSDGATVDNKFTEGNAALSVPATVVSAAIMNDIQEELCNTVEGLGITLVKGNQTQLMAALLELAKRGGRAAPIVATIANNQASAADVTGFPVFLSTQIVCIEFLYSIFRRTDSGNVKESGRAFITWNSETSAWEISQIKVHDESGVVLEVGPTGNANEFKLRYTSDSIAGASYDGKMRITDIKTVRVS